MNTPQQILDQSREEFEKRFIETSMWQLVPNTPRKIMAEDKDVAIMMAEISNWHDRTLQSFIEAEIAHLESKKKEQLDKNDPDNYGACYAIGGWNHCIQDQISHLKELVTNK